jgi:DTW domain-containing protein YfiP
MLVEHHCVCSLRPSVETRCAFCFIFYQGEVLKPSNTGRLIADVVTDTYAFQWQRTVLDPALKDLLASPEYLPVVVFPHEYAQAEQCLAHPNQLKMLNDGRKLLFIVLDGTWREAKKMFRSQYLQCLPVLGIQPQEVSDYQLREAAHAHQLCTAEVGVAVLKLQGEHEAASALQDYFSVFRERYMAGKANVVLKV